MRQIKFRVWSLKHKQWMGGSPLIDCNGNLKWNLVYENEDKQTQERLLFLDQEENIIQQFTGLLDKNGKEIYEGDIVYSTIYGEEFKGFIDFAAQFGFFASVEAIEDHKNSWVVIGNIFQNPSLLKQNV